MKTIEVEEYPGRPWKIAPDAMSDGQRALVKLIEDGPRGRVPPNLLMWMHDLDFGTVCEKFGLYVVKQAKFRPSQKEVIILAVAGHFGSDFERHFHEPMAAKAGLTAAQIAAIREGRDPQLPDPVDQVSWELVSAFLNVRGVPDALHARAMTLLGHGGVHDLVGLAGLYTMIAQTLAFYKVPVPKDNL